MSDLDKAMKQHMVYIVNEEGRPFSYKDFLHFEVDGIEYEMAHGTFRNKILRLRSEGIVEQDCHSALAFYTLKGTRFGKPMTPNHMGGQSCHQYPIIKVIQSLPFDKAALHNIRLLFDVRDCWNLLAESTNPVYELQPYSKDIRLPPVPYGALILTPTVHHNDKVTIDVGCSGAPIVTDIEGMIRLTKALTRVEERLLFRLEASSKGSALVVIPNSDCWIVTMWHFGRDSISEYNGKEFHTKWEIGRKELIRVYSKELPGGKTKVRVELQEYPQEYVGQVVKNIIRGSNPTRLLLN